MVSVKAVAWVLRAVRMGIGAVMLLTVLAGADPNLAQSLGLDALLVEWLAKPWVFIPLLMLASVLIWHDVLAWNVRRAYRKRRRQETYDFPARDAFKYLRLQTDWATAHRSPDECAVAAKDALEDALRAGQLYAWGRDMAFSNHAIEAISDSAFWTGTTLNFVSLRDFYEGPTVDTNERTYFGQKKKFRDVRLSKLQLMSLWPRASMLERWLLRRRMAHPFYDREAKPRPEQNEPITPPASYTS